MRHLLISVLLLPFLLVGCATDLGRLAQGVPSASVGGMERGTDRYGNDYRGIDMDGRGPEACLAECRADERCRAWTWTEPGYQATGGKCWLKNRVPSQSPLRQAVSGVVRPM